MLRGVLVLVVDDHPDIRLLVGHWLTRHGATMKEAGNGVEALRFIDDGAIDAVVTDMQMPFMDGLELLHLVRLRHPKLPVFIMTSNHDLSLHKAKALGATDVFFKPLAAAPLMAALEKSVRPSLH